MAKTPKQLNLGALIKALEAVNCNLPLRIEGREETPTMATGSYRGYYEDIAISYVDNGIPYSVSAVLEALRGAMGTHRLHGYKGGSFDCDASTSVWLGNYGSSQGAAVTGVKVEDGAAWLTWEEDEYTGWPAKKEQP